MMKEACERCVLKDKSSEVCQRRRCRHADVLVPIVSADSRDQRVPVVCAGLVIRTSEADLLVKIFYKKWFVACVLGLANKSEECGSLGRYLKEGRFYKFDLISDDDEEMMVWAVPDEGTELFHREGGTSSQVMLYWRDGEFTVELDS